MFSGAVRAFVESVRFGDGLAISVFGFLGSRMDNHWLVEGVVVDFCVVCEGYLFWFFIRLVMEIVGFVMLMVYISIIPVVSITVQCVSHLGGMGRNHRSHIADIGCIAVISVGISSIEDGRVGVSNVITAVAVNRITMTLSRVIIVTLISSRVITVVTDGETSDLFVKVSVMADLVDRGNFCVAI